MKKWLSGAGVALLVVALGLLISYTSDSQLQDREDAMLVIYDDMKETYAVLVEMQKSNETLAKIPTEIYASYADAVRLMQEGKPYEAIRAMEEGYLLCERMRDYLLEKSHFEKEADKAELIDLLNLNRALAEEFTIRIRDIDNVMAFK